MFFSSLYSATDTLSHLQSTITLILVIIYSTALDSLHYSFLPSPFFSLQGTSGALPVQNSCWIHAAKTTRTASFPEEQLCTFPDGISIFFSLAIYNLKHIKENQKDTGIKIASVSITRAVDTPGFWTHAKC